ncbi:hypothetical protein SA22_4216 [Salmonella enterica subsp. enterica serovar Agona str. 22.H.04]|uniref:Uncharacterized protein n=23 Tax=Salmonella enterica I TaxID=59201 RepID=A0A6C8GFZ4_SALET|nr:hypothetical protein SCH_3785 [Salmonella enterica subsp. enterica serovar Choleraesuis str. SC-B67]ABX70125.1 hypothetical protein SPAB_04814 [Salmonella enterica subsp. enterica serovar Paratyphi B str. SPB7]ACF63534.1 conserved hypothetical protein [Salmonella enterica subsp. enterica serovar Newport str. SL254]ACF66302.1 conserved hypothetical protein [Salmonella enterica subsp. enterica serovar Heidelberg str. SL476]ACF92554.1 conserved hypothetical protein [Salmonella enterica subsp. e
MIWCTLYRQCFRAICSFVRSFTLWLKVKNAGQRKIFKHLFTFWLLIV